MTAGPNSLVADLRDRMPVIVPREKYDLWLDPDVNDFEPIRDILKPYDANLMRRYPVSMKLNNSRIDDAESASPVTLDDPTQAKLFCLLGPGDPRGLQNRLSSFTGCGVFDSYAVPPFQTTKQR